MSILLIFQAAWIIQHLLLYLIDTTIIISHIFHFLSRTLLYTQPIRASMGSPASSHTAGPLSLSGGHTLGAPYVGTR